MSWGQIAEMFIMLLLPLALTRYGAKWAITVGLGALIVRYVAFLAGGMLGQPWLYYIAILIHGAIFGFLIVGGQVYVDKKAPPEIKAQAQVAISEADAVLFVNDGEAGVTPPDLEVATILRRSQKKLEDGTFWPPIFVVVNKCESKERRDNATQFYELGLGDPIAISAVHGTSTGDLLDMLVASFPEQAEEEEDESIKIALVGKPNAGKSSLLNKLVGEERAIVSPIPGTTRDATDTKIEVNGLEVTLIDTAGIRRRGKIEPGVEQFSVLRSFKAIERADVALLLIDATTGITSQDAHIAGFILEQWKSCVVIVNKWDAVEKDSYSMDEYTRKIRGDLNFMDYVPLLFISAKTGQRVDQVLPMALRVQEERLARLTTSKINEVIHNHCGL